MVLAPVVVQCIPARWARADDDCSRLMTALETQSPVRGRWVLYLSRLA
jgi:hypothetical protein